MIKINQSTKIVVSVFFLLTLSSCNTLISALATPKVNAELEELKSGQYRLDRSHAALIFKIQHTLCIQRNPSRFFMSSKNSI